MEALALLVPKIDGPTKTFLPLDVTPAEVDVHLGTSLLMKRTVEGLRSPVSFYPLSGS